MRWVKLTLFPPVRDMYPFRTLRLTSSSRAGTARALVAVGTARLASMLATRRAAPPRRGRTSGRSTAWGGGLRRGRAGAGAGAGSGAAGGAGAPSVR